MAKTTGTLKIIGDYGYPLGKVVINPNDGYDLGLLARDTPVKVHGVVDNPGGGQSNGYLFDGMLTQENDCRLGTVVVSLKFFQQLGKPQTTRLAVEGPKLSFEQP